MGEPQAIAHCGTIFGRSEADSEVILGGCRWASDFEGANVAVRKRVLELDLRKSGF